MHYRPWFSIEALCSSLLIFTFSGIISCGGGGQEANTPQSNTQEQVPPAIVTQPVDITVTAPQAAVFTVEASGGAPMLYQWKKNGANVGTSSPAFTIPATDLSDCGAIISVEVSNAVGRLDSEEATLTVTASDVAPTVTTQPNGTTVTAGNSAKFTVMANGTAPMHYQWKKNGSNVGTNSPSYTTPSTSLADDGAKFSVLISNSAGQATSAEAVLDVTSAAVPPSIRTQPLNRTVMKGYTATFSVAVNGTAPFTYQWKRNGSNLGSNAASYTTPATALSDNGATFSVVVSNAVGHVTSREAVLTVTEPPPPSSSCAPVPSSTRVVNVKDRGAIGNGSTNDTLAIQEAVDEIAGTGGTVLIPSGTYLVDAAGGGIRLGSNMTLRFASGSLLKARATSSSNYRILSISGASNVSITGSGTLQGERASHPEMGGEQGHGLTIHDSSHVVVENLTAKDCWGDGFYVGSTSTAVTLCNVVADSNRRAGMSITSVDGLTIRNSVFQNSYGTHNAFGLNIEPNAGETVNDVHITGCTFVDNQGAGLAAGVPCSYSATVSNLVIDANTVHHNGWEGTTAAYGGIEISKCSGTRITGNTCTNNAGDGILLRSCGTSTSMGANRSTVSANSVSNNGRAGILEVYSDDNTITSNTGSGNNEYGIHSSHCTNRDISGNDAGLPVTYTN